METLPFNPVPASQEMRNGRVPYPVDHSSRCLLLHFSLLADKPGVPEALDAHRLRGSFPPVHSQRRLSLSQRERIEVRDYLSGVSREPTKSLAEHCRVLRELGDSKIGGLQFRAARKTRLGSDHAVDRSDSCVRRRRVRWPALRRDNRNRVCMDPTRAVAGICIVQNFGSADFAKERAPIRSGGCADNERGSQEANSARVMGSREEKLSSVRHLQPLTSILSPQSGRGGFLHTSPGPLTGACRSSDSVRSAAHFQGSRVTRDLLQLRVSEYPIVSPFLKGRGLR